MSIGTRPDLSFAVSDISQYLSNPGHAHWEALKRVFRYLQGTKHWKLTFGGPGRKPGLEVYSDADGMSQETRHAISGYAFLLDGGAISWSSKKQELVTLSTTEAEYVALTHAAKEALWLRQFFLSCLLQKETRLERMYIVLSVIHYQRRIGATPLPGKLTLPVIF